ncbi:PLP-dependent aminotransferase family protein [bacterium]|nr:PLP-dependent aminotransferase family protein [bacterium]
MRYKIEKEARKPAYLQLYEELKKDIVSGFYAPGTKLPSKRVTAAETGLSVITVEHACSLLEEEGYIESREKSGYFVIFAPEKGFLGSPSTVFRQKREEPEPKKNQRQSEDDSHQSVPAFPFSVFAKRARKVMSEFAEKILDKSPNQGHTLLREAIRKYLLRSRGIEVGLSQIIIGSGAEHLYSLIVELLGRDKNFAIESPSYHKIGQVYSASNVSYEMLPLENDGISSAALWSSRASILHVTPYRSFPSGVSATASKRHEYINWADKRDRFIVEDDFESEFSVSGKSEETLFVLAKRNNVIYLNTFSKTLSPALRVGYMVLPPRLAACFEKRLGFYSCSVPSYIQLILAELLESGEFERHINRVRQLLRNRKKL